MSHMDLVPTILEGVGVPVKGQNLPGRSLWADSKGDQVGGGPALAWQDRTAIRDYDFGGAPVGIFTVREGKCKLIYYVGATPGLFDVFQDPNEWVDLRGTIKGAAERKRSSTGSASFTLRCQASALRCWQRMRRRGDRALRVARDR